ncbi:MAG: hypothetical protein JXJ20_11820 [Anaerolineae bacterium]|nr:hypothetical protein [Anaerolineae bacterium]
MRTVITLLLAALSLIGSLGPGAVPVLDGDGQRVRVLYRLGGQVTASVIYGPDVFAAEGDGLVRLRVDAGGDLVPQDWINLGHGAVLALALTDTALYALTESGIVTLSPEDGTVRDFTPGGGQALDVWGDRLVVAAREVGFRVYLLDAGGLPYPVHTALTAGSAQDVAFTEAGTLVVADGRAGLALVNIDNPVRPVTLGMLPDAAPAARVTAEEGRVYVTAGHQMIIVDTTKPAAPVVLGTYNPVHDARAAAWVGDYALIADADGGLKVYDARDPALFRYLTGESNGGRAVSYALAVASGMVVLGEGRTLRLYDAAALPRLEQCAALSLPGPVTALAPLPDESALLVTLESGVLGVVSLQDSANPVLLATLLVDGPARGVAVGGGRAYVTAADVGVIAVDVSDPAFPALADVLPISGRPGGVAAVGDSAVVAAGPAGLFVAGADGNGSLRLRGWLPSAGREPGYTAVMALGGARVAALDGDQLVLVDVANPAAPVILDRRPSGAVALAAGTDGALITAGANRLARYATGTGAFAPLAAYAAPTDFTGVRMRVGRAILSSSGGAALVLLDTQNPAAPTELQVHDVGLPGLSFCDQSDEVFLAAGGEGLLHTLLPPTGAPQLLGQYAPAWGTADLDGDGVRLLAGGMGWQVIRLADGGDLRLAGGAYVGNVAVVMLDGDRAYAAPESGGLLVYDLNSDPPERLARADTAGPVLDLAVGAGALWALDSGAGLLALDPHTLEPLGDPFWPGGRAESLALADETLLVGLTDGTLAALDVSGGEPVISGQLDGLGGPVRDVSLAAGEMLVVSAGTGGVWLVDGRDPADLRITGRAAPPGDARAAAVQDHTLAVAACACGVRLYDISDPARPVERGYWRGEAATDVLFQGDVIALATAGGLLTLEYNPGGEPVLPPLPHSPKPADGDEVPPGSVTALSWKPDADPCDPLRWEVSINGQFAGIVDQPRYDLPGALDHDLAWQVTAVDAQGDRMPGPVWHISAAADGWLGTPPAVRLQTGAQTGARNVRWGVAAGAGIAGLIALGALVWRRNRRRAWDGESPTGDVG